MIYTTSRIKSCNVYKLVGKLEDLKRNRNINIRKRTCNHTHDNYELDCFYVHIEPTYYPLTYYRTSFDRRYNTLYRIYEQCLFYAKAEIDNVTATCLQTSLKSIQYFEAHNFALPGYFK